MHQMFLEQEQANTAISYKTYWSVFHYHYNLGFGTPATDVCSTCVSHKLKIKNLMLTEQQRQMVATEFLVHKRKARMFYDRLSKTVPDSLTICFDVMENLVLPRTQIGQAYYSRQLYLYVFAIVVHNGKELVQDFNNVHLYTWREDQASKDSNIISSAVNHALLSPLAERLAQVNTLRVFSDSCFGQNKNLSMMSMLLSHIASRSATSKLKVVYNFPVRGHSYLPADRVFGRLEQDIRRAGQILLPSEYIDIMKKHGSVYEYGTDWQGLDVKKEVKRITKSNKSFKISEARVIELSEGKLTMQQAYSGPSTTHTVLKRGHIM